VYFEDASAYGRGVDAQSSSFRDSGCYGCNRPVAVRAGLFFESETNIWYIVSGGWLIGLGGDRLWRDFVAPFLGFEEVE
jgi:hypothetical protein